MKDIKDYLHLYLGCECKVKVSDDIKEKRILDEVNSGVIKLAELGWIKPILRPLSDMTEDEQQELEDYQYDDNIVTLHKYGTVIQTYVPVIFKRLLEMGFDLFGLIESGLAISKVKEEIKK